MRAGDGDARRDKEVDEDVDEDVVAALALEFGGGDGAGEVFELERLGEGMSRD